METVQDEWKASLLISHAAFHMGGSCSARAGTGGVQKVNQFYGVRVCNRYLGLGLNAGSNWISPASSTDRWKLLDLFLNTAYLNHSKNHIYYQYKWLPCSKSCQLYLYIEDKIHDWTLLILEHFAYSPQTHNIQLCRFYSNRLMLTSPSPLCFSSLCSRGATCSERSNNNPVKTAEMCDRSSPSLPPAGAGAPLACWQWQALPFLRNRCAEKWERFHFNIKELTTVKGKTKPSLSNADNIVGAEGGVGITGSGAGISLLAPAACWKANGGARLSAWMGETTLTSAVAKEIRHPMHTWRACGEEPGDTTPRHKRIAGTDCLTQLLNIWWSIGGKISCNHIDATDAMKEHLSTSTSNILHKYAVCANKAHCSWLVRQFMDENCSHLL